MNEHVFKGVLFACLFTHFYSSEYYTQGDSVRRYVSRKTAYLRKALALAAAVAMAVFLFADYKIKQYADIICKSHCSLIGENIINSAVADVLSQFDFSQALCESDTGFCVDSAQVSMVTSSLVASLAAEIENDLESYVKVPLGAFTGISFFSGSGPDVRVDIYAVGSPQVELSHSFEEAGLNQTCFSLTAEISLTFAAVMPSQNITVNVSRSVPLVQKVIVGEVPQMYFTE